MRKPDQEGEWCRALGLYAPPQNFYAEHAKLMQSVRAEGLRQEEVRDRWWRGRALALALGTQERIGERSPIRILDSDAFRAILAMVRAAGPASEAEYYADYPGRPSYRLIRRYPLLQASESPPAFPSLPSEHRYVGCWYVSASVFACLPLFLRSVPAVRMRLAGAARDHRLLATKSCSS